MSIDTLKQKIITGEIITMEEAGGNDIHALTREVIQELITQRDTVTSVLEGIAAFDPGVAGDEATSTLIELNVWTSRMQRVDGKSLGSLPHRPHRGSDVESFIKRWRDVNRGSKWEQAYDRLLDDYRLHADTGTPLTDPTPNPTALPLSQGGDGSAESIDIDWLKRIASTLNCGVAVATKRTAEREAGLIADNPEGVGIVLTVKGWQLVRDHGWDGDARA